MEAILINLGVAKKQDGKIIFNNAGVLFFAKEPQRFIPWSVFTVALFKDYGGADIIDRKEVEGSLFEIVEENASKGDIYEYPFEAIREAVINSVMHKYYFEHGHNNILKFFPDRIRIENYWQEPHNFILGETVFRRNQIIADLFARIHFGEKMGSGFERIREICNKENTPFPGIEFNPNYFYVTFRQSKEYLEMAQEEKVKETLAVVLTERQERAIEYLRENIFITTRVYASLVDVSERQARYDLNDLVEKNLIIAQGATKTRKYHLRQTSVKEGGEMRVKGRRI